MNAFPDFPASAKPHEVAVLLAYCLGYHDADAIANLLHYTGSDSVYRVMKKYRDFLKDCRRITVHKQQYVGPGFIAP